MSVLVNTQGPVQSKAWGLACAGFRVLSSGLMGLVCMNFVVYFADYRCQPSFAAVCWGSAPQAQPPYSSFRINVSTRRVREQPYVASPSSTC